MNLVAKECRRNDESKSAHVSPVRGLVTRG
jgi:hypothetical protein